MHLEILSKEQLELFPLLKEYKRNFYIVGGTAISLHIGHRKSIDFDLNAYPQLSPMKNETKHLRFSCASTSWSRYARNDGLSHVDRRGIGGTSTSLSDRPPIPLPYDSKCAGHPIVIGFDQRETAKQHQR